MKTVFTSHEIAHVWAHKLAPYGKSPGNASFSGDTFSSYSTVIARRIEHKSRVAFIVEGERFSVSTSKVQGRLWCALPSSVKSFTVHCGKYGQSLDFTPQTLRDHYISKAQEIEQEEPSRLERLRASQYTRATSALREALDVCEFFGLATVALSRKINAREARNAEAAQLIRDAADKRERAKLAKEKREAAARLARNIEFAEKYLTDPEAKPIFDYSTRRVPEGFPAELLAKLDARVKEVNAEALEAWRNGASVELPHDLPVMLRVERTKGESIRVFGYDEMVTSKGARVPLADAKRAFQFVMKARAKGWHRNGETFAVGGYHLDAVNDAGIVAGCHRITWEEIERFAKSQNWTA